MLVKSKKQFISYFKERITLFKVTKFVVSGLLDFGSKLQGCKIIFRLQ